MKKRLISILCILTFIITTFVQPVMAYDFDIISFEELRVAMVDKFAEYGIAFEIKQTEPNAIFTQKQLSEELKKIDIYGQKYVEYCKAQEKCIRRHPVAAFAAVSGHGAERVASFLNQ